MVGHVVGEILGWQWTRYFCGDSQWLAQRLCKSLLFAIHDTNLLIVVPGKPSGKVLSQCKFQRYRIQARNLIDQLHRTRGIIAQSMMDKEDKLVGMNSNGLCPIISLLFMPRLTIL
jgi:hypothetical protein